MNPKLFQPAASRETLTFSSYFTVEMATRELLKILKNPLTNSPIFKWENSSEQKGYSKVFDISANVLRES